jgi:hypothetical protein
MKEAKIKNYLEIATNIAVLLAALGFLSTLSWSHFTGRAVPEPQSGFQTGQALPRLPQVDYSSSPQTVLIAMNTQCHFCTESISFYNDLARAQQGKDKTTRIIAVFPNAESEVRQYVQQNQLQLETIAGADLKALNIRGTPTIILVNKSGKVLDFWVGKLSEDEKRQITNVLAASKM